MKKLFVIPIAVMVFIACQKDEEVVMPVKDEVVPSTNSSYIQLNVGNYWVYQIVIIDTLGQETEIEKRDSVVISGDTIIRGERYSVLEGTNYPFNGPEWGVLNCLRDSLGYLISEEGRIYFAENNFTDTLSTIINVMRGDTVTTSTYKMEKENSEVIVPAGSFQVLNFRGTSSVPDGLTEIPNPRYTNNYYAPDVGKILTEYFYISSNIRLEKRLLKYHIQK